MIVGIPGVFSSFFYGTTLFYKIFISKQFTMNLKEQKLFFVFYLCCISFFLWVELKTNQIYSATHGEFARLMGVIIYLISELIRSEVIFMVLYLLCFVLIWIGALIY